MAFRLARPLLLAFAFAATAVAARTRLEPEALQVGRVRDPAWLPEGRAVRVASMGQRLLLADLYWLRAVQYMGEMSLTGGDWRALLPLVEVVTDLDPRFGWAYQIAGSNLAGLAHRHQEADRILEKGMRNVPDRWSLPWVYAVNKFIFERDFATAGAYARRAAEVGQRPHLALLAANLSLVADADQEYAASEAILEEWIPKAEMPELREELEQRLVKVRTYAALSRVERALAAFRERFVRMPLTLEELVWQGLLSAVPEDPSGGTFLYEPATGRVRSSVLGERDPQRVSRDR